MFMFVNLPDESAFIYYFLFVYLYFFVFVFSFILFYFILFLYFNFFFFSHPTNYGLRQISSNENNCFRFIS